MDRIIIYDIRIIKIFCKCCVIIEPYITLPNYYNSDYNPLINNIFVDRLSTKFQDVDYSTDMFTPTNF